jgi:hypothetical protein
MLAEASWWHSGTGLRPFCSVGLHACNMGLSHRWVTYGSYLILWGTGWRQNTVSLLFLVHCSPISRFNLQIIGNCTSESRCFLDKKQAVEWPDNGLENRARRFCLQNSQFTLGPTQPSVRWVTGALGPHVKPPGLEGGHSPRSTAIRNAWSHTYIFPYALMPCIATSSNWQTAKPYLQSLIVGTYRPPLSEPTG